MPRIRYSAEVRAEGVRLVLESQVFFVLVAKKFGPNRRKTTIPR